MLDLFVALLKGPRLGPACSKPKSWLTMLTTLGLMFFTTVAFASPPILFASDASVAATNFLALFAVGTFWFWVVVGVEVIVLFSLVENDQGILAFVSLLVFGAILQWVSGVNVLSRITVANCLMFLIPYVCLGVIWSFLRFHWYYSGEVQKLVDDKQNWVDHALSPRSKSSGETTDLVYLNGVPDVLKDKWNKHIDESSPQVWKCKNKIIRWMAYWPVSLVWFLISDFCMEIFNRIYNQFAAWYEQMAQRIRNRAKV